jgi:hypothetical protein
MGYAPVNGLQLYYEIPAAENRSCRSTAAR